MALCSCGCGGRIKRGRKYMNRRSQELSVLASLLDQTGAALDLPEARTAFLTLLADEMLLHSYSLGTLPAENMPQRADTWKNEMRALSYVYGDARAGGDVRHRLAELSKNQRKSIAAFAPGTTASRTAQVETPAVDGATADKPVRRHPRPPGRTDGPSQ